VRVLDASTAHRVHPDWVYGFPELTGDQADRIRAAKRVSNPGCYPTGAVALIRPLVDAGLLPADYPVVIPAVSGYSGGGRSMIDSFEGRGQNPTTERVRLYALDLAHKHVEEMRVYAGLVGKPIFLPIVGAYRQGMLVEVPLFLSHLAGATGRDLHATLAARYRNSRFVEVMPFEPQPASQLEPEALNGTNRMQLYVFENADSGQAVLIARLDNLGKGASGAAAQNLDLMLGITTDYDYAVTDAS
jgi:N-acetyl-gamma-glutamyl-phosphate reductase